MSERQADRTPRVRASRCQKLFVTIALDETPAADYYDFVAGAGLREPMCDHQTDATLMQVAS